MIETFVRYVRIHTSVNVLRIDATAIAIGMSDGRQRPEDEEEDHERAEAADQRLGEDARPAAARGGDFERVAPGQVGRHARSASPPSAPRASRRCAVLR